MITADFNLLGLRGLDDANLLPWLELYETAFPAPERLLVAAVLRMIRDQVEGSSEMFLSAISAGTFAGLVHYERFPAERVAGLWYLAVNPTIRGGGLGSRIYETLWRELTDAGYRALVFEVEIPELAATGEIRQFAERRIEFYRRLGTRLLTGVDHIQHVGAHQPPVAMHVMVHAAGECSPEQGFQFARVVLGDSVRQRDSMLLV